MTPHVFSYEATTYLSIPRIEDIDAATEKHRIDARRGAEIIADLRTRGIDLPAEVIGIASAYATGETDDWEDGQLHAFVCVSVLVDATGIEDTDEFDVGQEILTAVYDALGLPDSIDGDFEYTDDQALDEFLADRPQARTEVEAVLCLRGPTP